MKRIESFNMRFGESLFMFVSDHAGCNFPNHLNGLNLPKEEQERHITYDIGIKRFGRELSNRLDATLIEQHFSRLVIDCNRKPEREDCIPKISDGTVILGNQNMDIESRKWRYDNIFMPYQAQISKTLLERLEKKKETIFVSLHSFTPQLRGSSFIRPWEVGLLFHHDTETSKRFKQILSEKSPNLCIGENEPYFLDLEKEYTVPMQAASKNIPALEIEIRQDILINPKSFQSFLDLFYQCFLQLERDLLK
ncbi:N-formylglutamate amidohydrolase [Acetobacteraceae bacterium]|nr:N-formylglutamate amidohydrolase [Acetobacteraceae bacterium]